MSVLVVGTVGLDNVETPSAKREDLLGGSAVYFAYAASFYTRVELVSVVGTDFPDEHKSVLEKRNVDLAGLEVAQGKTFRWSGRYHGNMIDRDTLETQLNVFGSFEPKLPESYRHLEYVFLANGPPAVQRKVLDAMAKRPKMVVTDTMNLWIDTTRPELEDLLKDTDVLVLNDSEARMLTGKHELLAAGREILKMGPSTVIVKKGEHGAMVIHEDGPFLVPAFPLEEVVDPTGAGDCFAGGIMGYLAECEDASPSTLRRAVAHGSVVASFTCEGFSLEALTGIERKDVDERYEKLLEMVRIG